MSCRLVLVAFAACSVSSLAAAQPVAGAYVNLGAGADFLQNQIFRPSDGVRPKKRSYTFDPGAAAEVSIGYGLGNGLRLEVEGDYADVHVRGVKLDVPERAGGHEQQYGGFLNAFYDFDLHAPVYPYIGVGAGYQAIELDGVNSSRSGVAVRGDGSEEEGAFSYQGIAGLSYPVGMMPGLSLTAEYRLIGVLSPPAYDRSSLVSGVEQPAHVTVNNTFNHEALLGLRYVFGAPPPPPPPAPLPATIAPPGEAPARTYLVFFDWDRADLTARARQIVAEAAAASTRVQTTRIEVSGYTDLSGTPAYNQSLSVRRAQTVESELVRDGVPRGEIEIQGYGESNPLVPTGKGVREPQNRRVEIVLK